MRSRYSELDGYRGIASLLILVFHCYAFPHSRGGAFPADGIHHVIMANLDAAVGWFFALSGLVIWLPFARAAIAGAPSPSRAGFLIRRAARILPAYYIVLIATWLAQGRFDEDARGGLLAHLLFVHVFNPAQRMSILGVAWSLGDEVWFYLVVAACGPLVVRRCGRLVRRGARTAALTAVAFVPVLISAVAQGVIVQTDIGSLVITESLHLGPVGLGGAFACGMLVATVAAALPAPRFGWLPVTALALVALAAIVPIGMARLVDRGASVGFFIFCAAAFTPVLAAGIIGPGRGPLPRIATARPLRALGTISFGVYLVHWPIITEFQRRGWLFSPDPVAFGRNLAILVPIVLSVATVLYVVVERPAIRLGARVAARATQRAIPQAGAPMIVAPTTTPSLP